MNKAVSMKAVYKKRPEHDASALKSVKSTKVGDKSDNSRPYNINQGNSKSTK